MTAAPRIRVLQHAVLRAAAWPVETVDAFAAPALFAAGVEFLERERWVLDRRDVVVDRIHAAVPRFADRSVRAYLLAVKRRVYGGSDPLPMATRAVEEAMGADPELAEILAGERQDRLMLREARAAVERKYDDELARQHRALQQVASEDRFRQALLLANPLVATGWDRVLTERPGAAANVPPKRLRRLERTVFEYVMRAAGRPTPSGAWAGVASIVPESSRGGGLQVTAASTRYVVTVDLGPFGRMLDALRGDVSMPFVALNAWEALATAGAALDDEDRPRWTVGVDRIRRVCDRLGDALASTDVAGARQLLREIDREVRAMCSWAGIPPARPDPPVHVDMRLPFSVSWTEGLRAEVEAAISEFLGFHAADGGAETARRAMLEAFVGPVSHPVELPLRDLAAAHDIGSDTSNRPFRGAESPSGGRRGGRLDPGPWGSVLVRLCSDSGPWIGPARPFPAMFSARYAQTLRDGAGNAQLLTELEGLGDAIAGPAVEIVGADPANLNAALRPPLTAAVVDARGTDAVRSASVVLDGTWRPRLRLTPHGPTFVPVYNSAAIVGRRHPCSALLFGLALAQGWDFAASRLPRTPGDETTWSSTTRRILPGGAVLSPRRWAIEDRTIEAIGRLRGADRYLAWIRECADRDLPRLAYVRADPAEPEILLPLDSPLAMRVLFDALMVRGHGIVVTELPGAPTSWPVVDGEGRHYAAEVAVTWVSDGWAGNQAAEPDIETAASPP